MERTGADGARLPADGTGTRRPTASPWTLAVVALLVLAVGVQAFVWGTAPAASSGGALLPGLRPDFGTPFAAVMLGAELAVCLLVRRTDAASWVIVAAALVDIVFWCAHAAGARFAVGGAAAMTSAFGAVAMVASLWWRRARPR